MKTLGPYKLMRCPEGFLVTGIYGVSIAYFGTNSIFHLGPPKEWHLITMEEAKLNAEFFLNALPCNHRSGFF
jgi:hypothetical protein